MNSYWVPWVAHALAQKIIVRQQNHCKSVTYLTESLSYQDRGRRSPWLWPCNRLALALGLWPTPWPWP